MTVYPLACAPLFKNKDIWWFQQTEHVNNYELFTMTIAIATKV